MAIKLKAGEGYVDLTTKKGTTTVVEDGGYYIPTVKEGILTWEPSEQYMPDVPSADIRGPQGEDGAPFTYDMFSDEQLESLKGPKGDKGDQGEKGMDGEMGVHVGTEEPTDPQKLIWINPEGEATDTGELATKAYVDEAIKSVPGADLTGYATEKYVDDAIAGIEIPKPDLSDYALKSEIPTVPTVVSAFTNDAGYLTEHQSLEAYALKTDIPDVSSFTTMAAVEAKGYQTAEQVQTAINTALAGIKNAEDGVY